MIRTFSLGDIRRGGILAIGAAILFGLSTPAAKAIVGNVHPVFLAGLLYSGSGAGLAIVILLGHRRGVRLQRADVPWLLATVGFGGALGPALLMWGLTRTAGSTASLLLTLEGVFTALIAWAVFREPFNRRIGLGMASIFVGAVLLGLGTPSGHGGTLGAVAIAGACLSWAIDNNCTSKIADVDALTLASIKGVVAGAANATLALVAGSAFALREIGAAPTGAYFSTAPFIGAVVGLVGLREPLTASLLGAGLLMGFGVYLHLTEQRREVAA